MGYSLVYVPNNRPIQQILGGVGLHKNGHSTNGTLGKTISKKSSRMSREHSAKPSNKFIMYRSFKSKELREINPDISQTEISCMTASLWNNESDEVKERFQNEYLKLKQEYDIKENMMRPGGRKLAEQNTTYVNRDEAERALAIAQLKWQSGDHAGGLRIARKSHALYPTELSGRLVEQYSKECVSDEKPAVSTGTSSMPSSSGTPQAASQKEGLRNRKADSDTQRTYTKEQLSAVKKVMKIKDDYYKVLAIERTATEAEVKKAYRKSALAFHPDKNTAPGADEAFKLVAHAFTVLSDKDKRAHYDRFGAESRGGPSHSAQQQHAAFNGVFGNARHRTAEDEISPEDLFNMFFGGDFGQFNVQFGPNGGIPRSGVRFGRRPAFQRGAQAQDGQTGVWASCMQMLPILLLIFSFFATSIVSLLFGGDSTPSFAFERTSRYSNSRVTNARNVVYWVNSNEFSKSALDRAPAQLWQFERDVEVEYISQLQRRCRQEREHKRNQIYLSQGWFGLGSDKKRLETAHAIPLPACDELRRFR
ncbi:Chaperone protein dnaJ [Coemansia sp. RSA 1972]|nr:Chaperone protein dnaJ [Coemansia sp. RSA 1972]